MSEIDLALHPDKNRPALIPEVRPGRLVNYTVAEGDAELLDLGHAQGDRLAATIAEARAGHEALQVLADGALVWVPTTHEGDGPGCWSWPTP